MATVQAGELVEWRESDRYWAGFAWGIDDHRALVVKLRSGRSFGNQLHVSVGRMLPVPGPLVIIDPDRIEFQDRLDFPTLQQATIAYRRAQRDPASFLLERRL